jgi:hypothetical protein
MSLITKDNRDWASIEKWPNPYRLTKNDLQGWLKQVPLEIITLILKEAKDLEEKDFDIKELQTSEIDGAFEWKKTKDGHMFWRKICDKDYQVFYDVYTPEKLRKRLEE